MIGPLPPVGDAEVLLRLVWDPQDISNGQLRPEAIRKADLRKPEAGVSVDRKSFAQKSTMVAVAAAQQTKVPATRVTAFVLSTIAALVREQRNSAGEIAFIVETKPLRDNLAHAEIASAKATTPSQALELRQLLLPLLRPKFPQKIMRTSV